MDQEQQAGTRRPVQARAEETRARILQKARDAFAEMGFAGASIRDIAREAGVTHSMITYHFGTKDGLWREAVRDMFALI
jgi:AcrR family transcriptional regulator